MSFILKKIELKNIRSHKEFVFEPALNGITAVSGGNGKGKSTIFNALSWALYGTKINSSTKNSDLIREGVSVKNEKCYVKVFFLIGEKEYLVNKSILTDKGGCECNVYLIENQEEKCLAGPSVSHTQKFIRQLLQMDEKSFLTSMFVQQKQVDNIMSTTGKERANIIEKLTGISSITEAIRSINEQQRNLSKSISLFQIEDLTSLKLQGNDFSKELKALKQEYSDLSNEYKEINGVLKEKSKQLEKDNKLQEIKKGKEEENRLSKEKISWLEDNSRESTAFLLEFKKMNKGLTTGSTKDLEVEYKNCVKTVSEKESHERQCLRDTEKLKVATSKGTPNKTIQELEAIHKTLIDEQTIDNKEYSLDSVVEIYALKEEIKAEKERQKHFESNSHTECPLCSQSIENADEIIVRSKEQEFSLKNTLYSLEEKRTVLKKKIAERESLIKAVLFDLDYAKNYVDNIKLLEEKESELKEISKTKTVHTIKLKRVEEDLKKARETESLVEKAESVKKTLLDNSNKIEQLKVLFKKNVSEIEKLNCLNYRDNQKLTTEVKELTDKFHKTSVQMTEVKGKITLLTEKLKVMKEKYNYAKEQYKKYTEISEKINEFAQAQKILDDFKRERITNSMPTLEFYSSDLLNKFTGGDFTAMNIDEKFNISVTTSDGKIRSISALSGGELSATAIALRVGISMLLSSSDTTLLVLDEALTAMDEVRARQIMETIASATNSQIIFIAHNGDINSIADKTVEI